MGVITLGFIPEGKRLGPIPSTLTLADPAFLIGHMTSDNRPDVHTVKIDPKDLTDVAKTIDWLPYVQGAHDSEEQNLEAHLTDGDLYYRTTRDVRDNEELLVWYSNEYAQLLGIPELQPFYRKDTGVYVCPYCMDKFRFPNSLRAHMRFKCTYKRQIQSAMALDMRKGQPGDASARQTHSDARPPLGYASHHLVNSLYQGYLSAHAPVSQAFPSGLLPSPNSSICSNSSSDGKRSPIGAELDRSASVSGSPSPVKRVYRMSSQSPSPVPTKKSKSNQSSPPGSPLSVGGNVSPQRRSPSPITSHGEDAISGKLDQNQNLHHSSLHVDAAEDGDDSISAFRKVEKSSPRGGVTPPDHPLLSPNSSGAHHPTPPRPTSSSIYNPTAISAAKPNVHDLHPAAAAAMAASFIRHPYLPNGHMPALIPASNSYGGENLPANLGELYRGTLKMGAAAGSHGMVNKLSEIRNIEVGKVPLLPIHETQIGGVTPFPFYKPHNPMVDKLLHAAPQVPQNFSSLNQNWCAKCNASFRMTSDLVYHMRSHHKREFDPLKRKREEKLKCNVCGESFRERHHLTRHMTSHM